MLIKNPFVQKWNKTSCMSPGLLKMLSVSFCGTWKWLRSQFKFVESLVKLNRPINKHVLSVGFTAEPVFCTATSEIWQWKKILWPLFYLLKRSVIGLFFFNGMFRKKLSYPDSRLSMNLYAFSAEYGKIFIPLLLSCRDFQVSTGRCHPTSNASFTWA